MVQFKIGTCPCTCISVLNQDCENTVKHNSIVPWNELKIKVLFRFMCKWSRRHCVEETEGH